MGIRINNIEPTVVNQETKTEQNLSFRRNDYEKSPDEDKFEKNNNDTIKKVAIGAGIIIGLAALGDAILAKGKHIKKIFGIAEKDAKKAGDKPTKPENKPKTDPKPDEKPKTETKTEPETKADDTKKPESITEPEVKAEEGTKAKTKPEPEVKTEESPKPATVVNKLEDPEYLKECTSFKHNGNSFIVSPEGEIISYKNAGGEELIEKYLNPVSTGDKEYKKIIDNQRDLHLIEQFNAKLKPAKDEYFGIQMSLENGKVVATATPTKTCVHAFLNEMPHDEIPEELKEELISIAKKQIANLQTSRPLENTMDTKGIEELRNDILTKMENFEESFISSDDVKILKEKILKAKTELEAKARAARIEEGKQTYNELNQKLDGRISVRTENEKSQELSKLAEKYHAEELSTANALKKKIARQTLKMKWFEAYLQDPQLRQVLGVAENAEIMFSRDLSFGEPYVRNQKGNILTYDRARGIWKELPADVIEKCKKLKNSYIIRAISQTKKADGCIITRSRNARSHQYDYTIRNLETGTETRLKDGKLYKLGSEGEEIPMKNSVRETRNGLEDFFTSVRPDAPNSFVYESPEAMFKGVKANQMAQKIEDYVATFDKGTFQRVDKIIESYNSEGKKETIHIIYEGHSFDIDDKGRLLQKVKVKSDPLVRNYQEQLESKAKRATSYTRNSVKQKQVLHA